MQEGDGEGELGFDRLTEKVGEEAAQPLLSFLGRFLKKYEVLASSNTYRRKLTIL